MRALLVGYALMWATCAHAFTVQQVPEPSALTLLGGLLLAGVVVHRLKKGKK